MNARLELVRRHGDGDLIAFSALQPDMDLFETSFGFWAYRRVHGMDVTLGGPVCAPSDRKAMFDRFQAHSARPIFFYLREDTLRAFQLRAGGGLAAAGIGIDQHADVHALLAHPAKEMRGALSKARKAHFALEPLDERDLPAMRPRLEAITRAYLARAECPREMSFLNRPMTYEPHSMRRIFSLRKRERGKALPEPHEIFGYAVLNPIFEGGNVTSYLLDILRFEPTRLWGIWPSTVYLLAERLAAEGLGLSLGFCPFHRVQRPDATLGGSRVLSAQIDIMVKLLDSAQYLRRLREMKSLVPGTEEPRFLASYTRLAPVVLFAFMEALGVGIRTLIGPDLVRVVGRGLRGAFSDPRPARAHVIP